MASNNIGLTPRILQPTAQPTDQYIRPATVTPLTQLAQGLSGIAPSLSRFAEATNEKQSAEDQIAGANTARKLIQEGKTYSDAIKAGAIEPHQSPWFRLGAYETFGRVSANTYAGDLEVAFKNSDASGSTNPKDFDAFEQKFRGDWMKENLGDKQDPYFSNAFGSHADNAVGGLRSNFAAQAGAKLVQQAGEAAHAEIFQMVEQFQKGSIAKQLLPGLIDLAQKRYAASGMSFGQINQLTASAIAAAAIRHSDLSMLDVMDQISTGKGKLSGTSYGSKHREDAETKISIEQQQKGNAAWAERERTDRIQADGITAEYAKALNSAPNPALVDAGPFISRVLKYDPAKATVFLGMRDAFAKKEYPEDEQVKRKLFLGVHTVSPGDYGYTDQARLDKALAAQTINPSTYSELSNQIKTRDKEGASKFFNDDGYKDIVKRVRGVFVAEFGDSKVEDRLKAEEAAAEAGDKYLRWRMGAGESADAIKVNQFINDQVNQQFHSKAGDLTTGMTQQPTKAQFGPQPVDHKKDPAAPKVNIQQLSSEFHDVLSKKTGKGLSPSSVSILRANKIPNNPKAIQDFIDAQLKLPDINP